MGRERENYEKSRENRAGPLIPGPARMTSSVGAIVDKHLVSKLHLAQSKHGIRFYEGGEASHWQGQPG